MKPYTILIVGISICCQFSATSLKADEARRTRRVLYNFDGDSCLFPKQKAPFQSLPMM